MKIFAYQYLSLWFCITAACFAQDQSPYLYGGAENPKIYSEYEKRGIDIVVCRWRHFFSSLKSLPLNERNIIYSAAKPYCHQWKQHMPLSVTPDVLGNYCLEHGKPVKPLELLLGDKERAVLCAKYELAQLYWQEKALMIFSLENNTLIDNAILQEQQRLQSEHEQLEKIYKDLLNDKAAFPKEFSELKYWSTPSLVETAVLIALMVFNKYHQR